MEVETQSSSAGRKTIGTGLRCNLPLRNPLFLALRNSGSRADPVPIPTPTSCPQTQRAPLKNWGLVTHSLRPLRDPHRRLCLLHAEVHERRCESTWAARDGATRSPLGVPRVPFAVALPYALHELRRPHKERSDARGRAHLRGPPLTDALARSAPQGTGSARQWVHGSQ